MEQNTLQDIREGLMTRPGKQKERGKGDWERRAPPNTEKDQWISTHR
jgi:hypothetical protein